MGSKNNKQMNVLLSDRYFTSAMVHTQCARQMIEELRLLEGGKNKEAETNVRTNIDSSCFPRSLT
jgi:thymidylate kinase